MNGTPISNVPITAYRSGPHNTPPRTLNVAVDRGRNSETLCPLRPQSVKILSLHQLLGDNTPGQTPKMLSGVMGIGYRSIVERLPPLERADCEHIFRTHKDQETNLGIYNRDVTSTEAKQNRW